MERRLQLWVVRDLDGSWTHLQHTVQPLDLKVPHGVFTMMFRKDFCFDG